jgi:hypothetical protein
MMMMMMIVVVIIIKAMGYFAASGNGTKVLQNE